MTTTLKAELMKHDMTVAKLRNLWRDARHGDSSARKRLFEIIQLVPQSEAMLKDLARQHDAKRAARRIEAHRPHKRMTQWESARATMTTAGARVIAGGLPSLGKRSK